MITKNKIIISTIDNTKFISDKKEYDHIFRKETRVFNIINQQYNNVK